MRIAKLSAQNLIDTFGDNDFFNVVYVSTGAYIHNFGIINFCKFQAEHVQ